jgi:hypothetical protein
MLVHFLPQSDIGRKKLSGLDVKLVFASICIRIYLFSTTTSELCNGFTHAYVHEIATYLVDLVTYV